MKKLSLSILAVMLSVCLLFALSVQCVAAEVLVNSGIGASENSAGENLAGDINNGFIEENPNNPNDGSGFTSDGTNESGNANGSYNRDVNGDSAGNGVNNGSSESEAAQGETSATDGNTETSSGFSWVMLLVWLVIIAAVILLIIALLPKRRNG